MNLQELPKDEIQEMSMVEIAFEIMKEERNPYDYYDLVKKVAEIKEMPQEEVNERIANLYTDMNIDGRFHSLGDNRWGLKSWYPLEQAEEEITTPVKPRKKAKASVEDVDTLDDDFENYEDEFEDLEDELDEIGNDDDLDEDEEDDTDFDDSANDIDEIDGEADEEDLGEEEEEDFR
ncbi:DNA-directed RNA polymerase delta subunit [Halalkalibacter wakoensis JCM 9140]|uniref:Probable DNA-directed RNA polymerase subunit delta n=1 Tax=Halalkalibacter wakoensis JCM 9140 TaxID=1236970 RepID=W4Q874_9BACI|nr:DNA-directed RNA polymerase subunit delta [Halalkalibacter wakoensis]GAE27883.1 DNA-directed RNA polymerase delta subunit [Halalkalibacter wakoensis JCM 9140]